MEEFCPDVGFFGSGLGALRDRNARRRRILTPHVIAVAFQVAGRERNAAALAAIGHHPRAAPGVEAGVVSFDPAVHAGGRDL